MTRSDNPKSHIQFIVPEQYLQGGAPEDPDIYLPFSGNVDAIEQLTPGGKVIQWAFDISGTKESRPTFALIYGHQGNTGELFLGVGNGLPGIIEPVGITDYAETDSGDWSFNTIGDDTYISRVTSQFSSVLVQFAEYDSRLASANLTVFSQGSQFRQLMFSRDYSVPMHNNTWSCKREFRPKMSASYLKQESPRFHLTNEYAEIAEHSFEWTGLGDSDRRIFDIFFAAFGGNVTRPFAMCVIHGGALTTMDCRMLVINEPSISWKHDREMNRDGLKFTATELIPI
jgi:hypothetical protein